MDSYLKGVAYSLVDVKDISEDKDHYIIKGIATTPSADREGDVVDPMGASYKLPIPFVWQHSAWQPIGRVESVQLKKNGIPVEMHIPKVAEAGRLKDRIDEAVQSIKYRLVTGLSIGFRANRDDVEIMSSGGLHFKKWEWLELSLVTIPANADASITSIKSYDQQQRASSGNAVPVARINSSARVPAVNIKTVNAPGEGDMKTIAEQIAEFEAARTQKAADMALIMQKSADTGLTLDAEQSESYDTLESEVAALDSHIDRLKKLQATQAKTAQPVTDDPRGKIAAVQSKAVAPAVVKSVKNEEPGVAFARFALAMYAGKGQVVAAKGFADSAFGNDARLSEIMKAAVAAGTTTSPEWAGNLVEYQTIASEFLEYLRPRTILGQFGRDGVPSLRAVPFNVRIPGKTAAGRAQWVGEGYRKPVTSSGYDAATLGFSKIAAISVVSDELQRFADPSVQLLVRDDLAEAVVERMDLDFVDPAKAAGTGSSASPASITNGVTAIPSTGSDVDDIDAAIAALWETADATNMPASSAVYITDSRSARALSRKKNPLGQRAYPEMRASGGSIDGVPVIVSNYVPATAEGSLFILAFASEIYLADDGVVNIAFSREATIVMNDDATATPTIDQIVSMFQTNQEAIRAERYVHWKKRRPQAVAYLSGVNWGGDVAGDETGG